MPIKVIATLTIQTFFLRIVRYQLIIARYKDIFLAIASLCLAILTTFLRIVRYNLANVSYKVEFWGEKPVFLQLLQFRVYIARKKKSELREKVAIPF